MDKIAVFIMGLNTNLLIILTLAMVLLFSAASGLSFILLDKKISKILEVIGK